MNNKFNLKKMMKDDYKKYVEKAESATFFGIEVSEMKEEDIKCLCGFLLESRDEKRFLYE